MATTTDIYEVTANISSSSSSTNLSKIVENECTQEVLTFEPSCTEFLAALGLAGWILLGLATVAFIVLVILYADTVAYVTKYHPPRHKATTVIVLSVYPVLGLCSFLGLLFQKANLFLDSSAQLWFALCMWQFLVLTLNYFGGESRFVSKMEGTVLPWKGPPCCCWPCCICPKWTVNKRQIRFVKILVLQHPWVQLVMTILQVTLWLEGWYTHMDMRPTNAYIYIYLVATTSFGFGLWAFIVGFKASLRQLKEFYYVPKIIVFQLCLVFLRLQAIIVNSILVPSGAIPCLPPISPTVFANTLLNSLLLGQLVVLSVLARHYYKLPIPEVLSMSDSDDDVEKPAFEKNPSNGHLYLTDDSVTPNGKAVVATTTPSDDKSDDEPLLDGVTVTVPSL